MASAVEQIEIWMHGHPRTAIFILTGSLVVVGLIIGLALATNVYNDGMTAMFEEAAFTGRLVDVNDKLYSIQEMNESNVIYQDHIWERI
jgi:hypothetical protein